ncbi:glycosyltransferase family 4 protein [Parashewanella tropica]|uniref:glycosyltransferase family 4 protein n=1 Tax=Parashewanella tropica TaxID=2547970 RepID=UPI00105A45D7|nr:glycosyltransferase family 4 protein [Parashewanella tropica]
MKKIKIWFVGGEDVRMRIPLLLELRKLGYEIGVIGTESPDPFEVENIPYIQYSLNRWVGPFSDLKSYSQLSKIFSKIDVDIIHGFDTKPAILVPLASRSYSHIKSIRTITGMGFIFSSDSFLALLLKPVYSILQKLASRNASKTVFQNNDDLVYFQNKKLVEEGKIELVRSSGIDLSSLPKLDENNVAIRDLKNNLSIKNELVIIMVARLVKDKGVLQFLEAAKRVKNKSKNVRFFLVGPSSGEGKEAISINQIQEYSDYVTYLGKRKDINLLLKLSDVFVLPSYYREGVPRVLLEAGGASLPLITTNMPGCKEVVIDKWNGWLVKPRSVEDLEDKILNSLKLTDEERKLMGERSLSHVTSEFSLSKVVKQYSSIYQNMMINK